MTSFADTAAGKILIGVVVAIIGSLFGAFLTWVTISNQPPAAEIVPNILNAEALAVVNFSAKGSIDPDGEALTYDWSLNALPFGSNPAARCSLASDPAIANCQFVMPGTHAVTVTVEDESGSQAAKSATITVSVPSGYFSLFIQVSDDETVQSAAERALLYAVDWGAVQTTVGRPVLIFDPDLGSSVYGSTVERDIERARRAIADKEVRDNFKIGGLGLRQETKDLIAIQAAEAGISITFFDLGFGEIVTGVERGVGDGGFLLSDSPAAFSRLQRGKTQ
ncbi:MAG: PKD domain-containing protein [Pseudomonadota bacterium]